MWNKTDSSKIGQDHQLEGQIARMVKIHMCVCVCVCVWSNKIPGPETATHSSILAWRIPWTEKPGGLQSMGSQRVGRN